MLKFVTFSVKMQLNVHNLNNEAVAGNVTDIRIMEFLDEEGKRQEAPAVSGRMLKHWHIEGMKHLIVNGSFNSVPLCAGCKAGEPIRPSVIKRGNLVQVSMGEQDAIISCAVCDIHGYLIAQDSKKEAESEQDETGGEETKENKNKKETKQKRGISARRNSRAMFSWLMPALSNTDMWPKSKQVIHNRVSADPSFMMPFSKSYASGIYAFVSALDVDRIGLIELNLGGTNAYAVDDNNGRKERIKVAIEAYRFMLSGQIGASLSHAVPHANPIEILVAYSETGPLPFPVSPIYSDYIKKTIGLMPKDTFFLYMGDNILEEVKNIEERFEKVIAIDEIFTELLTKI